MDRIELKRFILDNYSASSDTPWINFPGYEVFRHNANRKWFAVIMNVQGDRFGLPCTDPVDIVNFKCDPVMVGSFLNDPGFFPAYHMNKEKWISVSLDGQVPDETILFLLDFSYESTSPHKKRN